MAIKMVSRLQRRIAVRRKLHILRSLTCSKSLKRNSIIKDALLYIYKFKLKLEAIKRELSSLAAIRRDYLSLMEKQVRLHKKKEVKVEKAGKGFVVRVNCEKGGDELVSILEVFEEMGLIVLHARVSSNFYFAMEAIVVAQERQSTTEDFAKDITQAVVKALERQSGEKGTDTSMEVSVRS